MTQQRAELEPISMLLASVVRRSWIVLLCAGLVFAGVWTLIGPNETEGEVVATSRVGVTTEVVWPFYDVMLERGRAVVADPSFLSVLEQDLGEDLISIRTIIPKELSVFDIEVTAATGELAVRAADRAAAIVVERGITAQADDRADRTAALESEVTALQGRIDELTAEMAEQDARLAELSAQQDVEYTQAREQESYVIQSSRDVNQALLNDRQRDLGSAQSELSVLQATDVGDPEYEVLRLASSTPPEESSRLPISIAAAIGAALIGAAGAIVLDRRIGRVRSAWQLSEVCGAPAVVTLRPEGQQLRGVGALSDQVHRAMDGGDRLIGVVNLTRDQHLPVRLLGELRHQGLAVDLVDGDVAAEDHRLRLLDVSEEFDDADAPRLLTPMCDTLVVAVDRTVAVSEARAAIDRGQTTPGITTALFVDAR